LIGGFFIYVNIYNKKTMKHLLNDMSSEEKNSIREQHTGGIKIDTSRFRSLLESTLGNAKPLVSEQSETKVAGPIGAAPLQYYIYNKGGKFYIYQTNATQKTPILMQGTDWSNNGQGYNTQDEAEEMIQKKLPNKPSYSDEDTENEPPIEVNEEEGDDEVVVNVNDIAQEDMKCFSDVSAEEALKVGLNHGGRYKVKKRGCMTKTRYKGPKQKYYGNNNF
jgi:hypothetical protein